MMDSTLSMKDALLRVTFTCIPVNLKAHIGNVLAASANKGLTEAHLTTEDLTHEGIFYKDVVRTWLENEDMTVRFPGKGLKVYWNGRLAACSVPIGENKTP